MSAVHASCPSIPRAVRVPPGSRPKLPTVPPRPFGHDVTLRYVPTGTKPTANPTLCLRAPTPPVLDGCRSVSEPPAAALPAAAAPVRTPAQFRWAVRLFLHSLQEKKQLVVVGSEEKSADLLFEAQGRSPTRAPAYLCLRVCILEGLQPAEITGEIEQVLNDRKSADTQVEIVPGARSSQFELWVRTVAAP